MNIVLTINTDNEAFQDGNAGAEVGFILRRIAEQLRDWPGANEFNLNLRDSNGNKVGRCEASTA